MDIIETRRQNLRRWVAEHGTPSGEKSLFSQLKSNGSFGERVARRLEEQYGMGAGYLDRDPAEVEGGVDRQPGEVTAPEETADEMLRRAAAMIETYRLAGPADRERIDLVFRDVRERLTTINQTKTRAR